MGASENVAPDMAYFRREVQWVATLWL